jgi:hypothetical protein
MRIMIGVLACRLNNETMRRLLTQQWDDPLEIMIFWGDDQRPGESRFAAITRKYQAMRDRFLAGPYDALLTVEDDMYIPSNAIADLVACRADVAYGLYVWRYVGNHWWNAYAKIEQDAESFKYWSLSFDREQAQRHIYAGSVIKVEGLGFGCTLIQRHVLESIPFRIDPAYGGACNDTFFAWDCKQAHYTQVCDLSVVCGHRIDDRRVIWPDGSAPELYRIEGV